MAPPRLIFCSGYHLYSAIMLRVIVPSDAVIILAKSSQGGNHFVVLRHFNIALWRHRFDETRLGSSAGGLVQTLVGGLK
ncbi:MAG TPA: hypothetical protein VE890_06010 [Thermoguttaceae bacterium]|nr:hypothetical protein [Thermoguttaceae bacterium]